MSCSVEIIDFTRPERNRKNLFITNIPGNSETDIQWLDADVVDMNIEEMQARFSKEMHSVYRGTPVYYSSKEKLYSTFSRYGLIFGIQIYPTPPNHSEKSSRFYAFVTFYSALAASRSKESLCNKITIDGVECKIAFAKRKKDIQMANGLHFSKSQELANFYLGFNGWSTTIKVLKEDDTERTCDGDLQKVRYVCVSRIDITGHHLYSEGMGAWEETYLIKDPTSKAKAICKSKKLAYQRSIENAFSKVILIVLPNGKVTVEVDTTKPDLILTEKRLDEDKCLQINELDEHPGEDDDKEDEDIDAVNLHILHELEEEM